MNAAAPRPPATATSSTTRVARPAAVTVSPMRRRHLDAVLAIETQVYPRAWSARLFEAELERAGRVYLVASAGPRVVGYSGVLMIADDGHVATVAVDPTWQGRQVATRLLVELVRRAVGLGAEQLTLEVRMSNTRAQELYRRFGFVPAGARKGYYADNGEDALVMWAHEVASPDYAARLVAVEAALESPPPGPGPGGSSTPELHRAVPRGPHRAQAARR